ncbi:MAG TPA: hypothetical protein VHH36_03375 [Candidatus Thermoplasmatota archaeon]|nr:hypothetical protein [Candidatus Thermoplasmatota archaeon]
MIPVEAVAYPALLVAIYQIHRVGRRRAGERFEWTRVATLAILLGVVMALQVRFAAAGVLDSPLGLATGAMSIAGVFGLVGMNLLDILRKRETRELPAGLKAWAARRT